LLLVSLALLLIGTGCSSSSEYTVKRNGGEQDVSFVRQDNSKMNAAVAEARRTTPQFLAAMAHPRPTQQFSVKMTISNARMAEHMWLDNLTYEGQQFHGTLMDDPYDVGGYRKGQAMSVKPDAITDWIMVTDGVPSGGYTEKVLEVCERLKPYARWRVAPSRSATQHLTVVHRYSGELTYRNLCGKLGKIYSMNI